MNIRYLSLFSGIEAATVAWEPLGWTLVAFAQYEPDDSEYVNLKEDCMHIFHPLLNKEEAYGS